MQLQMNSVWKQNIVRLTFVRGFSVRFLMFRSDFATPLFGAVDACAPLRWLILCGRHLDVGATKDFEIIADTITNRREEAAAMMTTGEIAVDAT